jgi:hypothetical protein
MRDRELRIKQRQQPHRRHSNDKLPRQEGTASRGKAAAYGQCFPSFQPPAETQVEGFFEVGQLTWS